MPAHALSEPVHLPLPEPWPEPHKGCDVCGALATQRLTSQAAGDYSAVTDFNVEIRAHRFPYVRRRR
ncbi:hypothetical protein [Streptomyces sp. NPDC046942]|uniref:hypothetical protein n=1 Tax=Streptomyces sp. NPDC046942 TaxID=3155137 RepID=UPI0033F68E0D